MMNGDRSGGPILDPAVALERMRGGSAYPPGFYGTVRQRIPVFAAVGALSVLAALIPFPHQRTVEILVTGTMFFALTTLAVFLPWRHMPQWFWPIVPIAYVGVIALLRDAQGGTSSGLVALFFLPIIWLAFYGRRTPLIAGLCAVVAAMVIPIVLIGPPAYPSSEWRLAIVTTVVLSLVSFSFLAMVGRDRAYVADMAEQSLLAQENARQALQAREQMDSLLDAATETAVIGTDHRGIVRFFSAGAERMFGYTASQVVGQREFIDRKELAARQGVLAHMVESGMSVGVAEESIWTFVRRDGNRRRCAVTITPQRGVDNQCGFVIVAHDVTEREHLEGERERLHTVQREATEILVEQNNRLRELAQIKDNVVATVSHELRTPLTAIRGFIELLLDDKTSLTDEQARMLNTIDRSSNQLLAVTQDLLDNPGGGHQLQVIFVDTDLCALAADAVEVMTATAAASHITLTLVTKGAVLVRCDVSRLHQLLANLLSNAVKFNPAGGRVEVRVSHLAQLACLEVLDNGPGIPVAERPQLFERFYRLASTADQGIPGSGLGLAIAKTVVEVHGGTIEIVDTPGWSTTFRVYLPLAHARPRTVQRGVVAGAKFVERGAVRPGV